MKELLCRIFSLNQGELKKVFLFALIGFLWSLAATSGLKYSDAMFIYKIGASSLSSVYTIIPCGMILISIVLLYTYHHYDAAKVFQGLLLTTVFFYGVAFFCLSYGIGTESNWLWYGMRIMGALFLYPLITSYWTFIDQYYKTHDAKRLFGLFCSIIYLGSTATGLIMKLGIIEIEQLFPFVMVLLVLSAYGVHRIAKRETPCSSEEHSDIIEELPSLWEKIKLVLTFRYTALIFAGSFAAILLWVIAEFNYMSAFEARFSSADSPKELTQFLGQCFSTISVINVLFGIFLYGRLVRKVGVGSAILITPLLYLFVFSGWLVQDAFIFPLMGMLAVEGSAEVMDNSNLAFLVKASPGSVKSVMRVMVECIFEPLGMLSSGLLISLSFMDSKLLGMIIAFVALAIAVAIRSHYSLRFRPQVLV